ncbi:MAG: zinc ribbon domain-containing protein [Acidobacteria bacterium]|nr:zinc ribbon domain-containing protein [Acidobacteriota bacterium]
MYCSSCGAALAKPTKFCNRCGAQLQVSKTDLEWEASEKRVKEKRLDEYLDGLFWITVFGLGFVLGGMVVLKKMDLSNWLIASYLVISSTAFLINLALSLWQIYGMTRKPEQTKFQDQLLEAPDTNELAPASGQPILEPALSITENTTHRLERVQKDVDS